MMQRQYIDASNDKSTGKYKEVGTIADYKPVSLEEHWNSDYMKDIRKKLLAGETIPQCAVCNDSILSQSTYRQWFTGHLFKDKIEQAFEETDDSDEVQNSNAAEKNPYDLLVGGGVKREGVVNSSRSGRFSSTLQEDDP
jgi:hypothetical protein